MFNRKAAALTTILVVGLAALYILEAGLGTVQAQCYQIVGGGDAPTSTTTSRSVRALAPHTIYLVLSGASIVLPHTSSTANPMCQPAVDAKASGGFGLCRC